MTGVSLCAVCVSVICVRLGAWHVTRECAGVRRASPGGAFVTTLSSLKLFHTNMHAERMGGNAVPYSLGAGAGSKGASMYQARAPRRLPRAARAHRSPCSVVRQWVR